MNIHRCSSAVLFLIGTLYSGAAVAAPPVAYKATLLHPLSGFANSEARSVDGDWQVGFGHDPSTGNIFRAFLWNNTAQSMVDLTPTGANGSSAWDIEGNTQGGSAVYGGVNGSTHATLWQGTPESAVDLHPAAYSHSGISAISGNSQVGNGAVGPFATSRALLWHGTAASVVSLHLVGYEATNAEDLDSSTNTQVGWGSGPDNVIGSRTKALLWHGSAASGVSLHPAAFEHSQALGVSGNNQVGYGQITPNGGPTNALLWHGSAEDYVNLHPAGFDYSYAIGISGDYQVGNGILSGGSWLYRALVWNGTAASAVDLHPTLAELPVALVHSYATNIDANGRIVGFGRDSANRDYAILWTPVPEPGAGALLLIAALAAQPLLRHRSRQLRKSRGQTFAQYSPAALSRS